jgi:hypothetical protein
VLAKNLVIAPWSDVRARDLAMHLLGWISSQMAALIVVLGPSGNGVGMWVAFNAAFQAAVVLVYRCTLRVSM